MAQRCQRLALNRFTAYNFYVCADFELSGSQLYFVYMEVLNVIAHVQVDIRY